MRDRFGFELPLLLAGAFRALIDDLHTELGDRGHPEARPLHGFALQAVGTDGVTISELGRRLGVSKQAAAKTAAALERLGYAERAPDPSDGRSTVLRRTTRGEELLSLSAEVFERLHTRWSDTLGATRLGELEDDLERIAGTEPGALRFADLPGWLR